MANQAFLRSLAIACTVLVSPALSVAPAGASDNVTATDEITVTDDSDGGDALAPKNTGEPESPQNTHSDSESASDVDSDSEKAAVTSNDDHLPPPSSEDSLTPEDVVEELANQLSDAVGDDMAEAIVDEVTTEETVRIIVTLSVDTDVESELTVREVSEQRAEIAEATETLLDEIVEQEVDIVHELSVVPMVVLDVSPEGLLDILASDAVASVALDELVYRAADTDPDLATTDLNPMAPAMSQSLDRQGIADLHSQGILGQGTSIAVLDDGVDKNHPFFSQFDENGEVIGSRVVAEACFSSASTGSRSLCPEVDGVPQSTVMELPNDPDAGLPCTLPDCDHGTHVAGIAAGGPAIDASGNIVTDLEGNPFTGVAPEAGIVALQVFHEQLVDGQPSGGLAAFSSDIIAGLEWVYLHRDTHDTRVVNMSLGGGRATTQCSAADQLMTAIITNLLAAGIPTVIASGNNGWSDAVSFPGCISEAWTVGSTRAAVDDISWFTNTHPTLVDLYAVGSGVLSSVRGDTYAFFSGTSMAAPQVAGSVALLSSTHATATPSRLLSVLQCTGTSVTLRNGQSVGFSRPRIDIHAAHTTPCAPATPQVTRGDRSATVRVSTPPHTLQPIQQYEATCQAPGQATRTATGSATSLSVTSLTNGVTYSCSLRAHSTPDTWSVASPARTITPAAKPSGLRRPTVVRGNTTARVTLPTPATNGARIIQYQARCYARGQTTRSATSSSRAITVRSLKNNVGYSCQVRARNDVGWSTWSPAQTLSPAARPSRPSRPSVVKGNTTARVTVSTPRSNGAQITRYQAKCSARGQTTRYATSTSRSVTVRSLKNNVTYSCQMRAQNALGWSSWSTTRNVRPSR